MNSFHFPFGLGSKKLNSSVCNILRRRFSLVSFLFGYIPKLFQMQNQLPQTNILSSVEDWSLEKLENRQKRSPPSWLQN